jgi:hypothetical protein
VLKRLHMFFKRLQLPPLLAYILSLTVVTGAPGCSSAGGTGGKSAGEGGAPEDAGGVPATDTGTTADAGRTGDASSGDALPREASTFSDARVEVGSPEGGGAASMPIISFGAPAYAENAQSPASNANDGTQDNYWRSVGYPTWLAYDLSDQPAAARQKIFVSWWAPATYGYDATQFGPSYNLPGAYVLEGNAAAGGTGAAPSSGWVQLNDPAGNAISVTNNVLNGREHVAMLNGMSWIRWRATAGASTNAAENTDAAIALDVHDASGGIDAWNLIGDSITAFFQIHNAPMGVAPSGYADGNFSYLIHDGAPGLFAGAPAYRPAFNGNGEPGSKSTDWVTSVSQYIPLWPSPYVGIQLGANDAGTDPSLYYSNMVSIITQLLSAGKTVYVATPSWQSVALGHQDMSQLAAQVPLIVAGFKGSPVYAGPDMYAFFSQPANQTYITTCLAPGNCGLHPTAAGQAIMRDLWAQAACGSHY